MERIPQNVWEQICRQLIQKRGDNDFDWGPLKTGCGTLTSLARTCRILHEPSLNVLWHTIPDIFVLFYSLPDTCYQKQADQRVGHYTRYTFLESVHQADLTRLLAYAQRVRVVQSYLPHIPRKVSLHAAAPSTYDFLADVLQSRPLLPNVQSVEHNILDSDNSHKICRSFHILFGPRLHTLELEARYSYPDDYSRPQLLDKVDLEDEIACMLSKVSSLAPNLRELRLCLDPSSRAIAAAVSLMLCGLNKLTSVLLSFDQFPLTAKAFVHLALLPNLRNLEFCSDRVSWSDKDLALLNYMPFQRGFPALQTLEVVSPTLRLPTQVLQYVTSSSLAEIRLETTRDVPRREIRPLFSAISGHPSRDALRALHIEVKNVIRSDGRTKVAPDPICAKTLAPLWRVRGMRSLSLNIHCPFDVDDVLLHRISRTWPWISCLVLGARSPWGSLDEDAPVEAAPGFNTTSRTLGTGTGDGANMDVDDDEEEEEEEDIDAMPRGWRKPRATLSGMEDFLFICSWITTLGVEFDATAAGFPRHPRKALNHSFRPHDVSLTLYPGLSPIGDPYAVASFLSNIFPDAMEVDVTSLMDLEPQEDHNDRGPEQEWWCEARKFRGRWETFEDVLPKLATIREQERKWRRQLEAEAYNAMRARLLEWQLEAEADEDSWTDVSEDSEASDWW